MEVAARHLISPNLHVILVHFPLGIFVFGLFLEVFGLALWPRSSARLAAKWMILLGGLMSVPAALTGIDAYKDLQEHMQHEEKMEGMRRPVLVTGFNPTTQWPLVQKHILFASIGAGLAAIGVTIGLGLSGTALTRAYVYGPVLLVLIAAAVLMVYGSHFGGEGVYLGGVAVAVKRGAATSGTIEWWAPALSTHILFAGLAMATGLGALGASWRLIASHRIVSDQLDTDKELAALAQQAEASQPPRRVTDDLTMARTLNADTEMTAPRIPSARFWLLTSLLFITALGMGVWYLISSPETKFDLKHASPSAISQQVWQTSTETKQILQNKRGIHIGLGIALAALPLLLALVVRFMYRQKIIVSVLLIVMALLIFAEVWIGVLLSFRGHEGPIYKFQKLEAAQAEA